MLTMTASFTSYRALLAGHVGPARATLTAALALVVALTTVTTAAAPASADENGSLCSANHERLSPTGFAADYCFDGQNIKIRNMLDVPISIDAKNSGGSINVSRHTISGEPEIATVWLSTITGSNILPPHFEGTIPVGSDATTVRVGGTNVATKYAFAKTVIPMLDPTPGTAWYEAFGHFEGAMENTRFRYRQCNASASNPFAKTGCTLGATTGTIAALSNYADEAALGLVSSLVKASAGLLIEMVQWPGEWSQDVKDIGTLIKSNRTLNIAAAPAPPAAPTTATAPEPDPATEPPADDSTGQPEVTQPVPTQTVPAPPPTAPQPGSGGPKGYTVNDSYLSGTWARTDPNDGTWHSKGNPPANGAYWYPNGLGVGVDCARTAAAYSVKNYGRTENWTTWFHVTDGKWMPAAVAIPADGFDGLPTC